MRKQRLRIERYDFGSIVIDGKRYTSDVIIYPDKVNSHWWRKEGHLLQLDDIKEVLKEEPEIIIVGTGNLGQMHVSSKVKMHLENKGIELIIEKTKDACSIYNKLFGSKKVIATLHLTC